MNNYEKIKNMTIKEMAELFATSKPKCCGLCHPKMGCLREVSCTGAIKDWLGREMENE
jgi:hypothetical protein